MTTLFLYEKEIELMKLVINEDLDIVKSTLHNTNIIRKVDSSGTINIPKSIRESMGIEANDEVYLYVDNTNNTIAIRKVNSNYIAEDSNINTEDMTTVELAAAIMDLMNTITFTNVDTLSSDIFNDSGEDVYYELNDALYNTLKGDVYRDTYYPIKIENTPILFKITNNGTLSFLFINKGITWTITKRGRTNMNAFYTKKEALTNIYNILSSL